MNTLDYWETEWGIMRDVSDVTYNVAKNNSPQSTNEGGSWISLNGHMVRTKYNTEEEFRKSGDKGYYWGKTAMKNGTYYSLFGQKLNPNTLNAQITKCIDDVFIEYARYYYDYIYKGREYHGYTDFSRIIQYNKLVITTSENMYDYHEMGRYANQADIYFFVSEKKMKGRFNTFTIWDKIGGGNGIFSTPKGKYLTIQYPSDYTSNDYCLVGLNFKTESEVQLFKNKIHAHYPFISSR